MPLPVLRLSLWGLLSWLSVGCREFPEIRHILVKVPECTSVGARSRPEEVRCRVKGQCSPGGAIRDGLKYQL